MTDFPGILPPLARALTAKGYSALTQVQVAVSDPELAARDLLVSAQTGSGKTVGFGIAIAPSLLGEAEKFGRAAQPLALAVAPTRELALQVRRELEWLYGETGARIASCVGGMDMRTEIRALDRGAHIVVGTPGRLRDHIQRGSLDMSETAAVVLDEADEMLDLGFRDDLEFILGSAPETRRTLLFSATVPRQIGEIARKYQTDAARITTSAEQKQHVDIDYQALVCSPRDKENAIINLLRFHEPQNALVFCATRMTVNHMTARFTNRGFQVVALSGELSQKERSHALQAMRDGRAQVCIATDVAARGIDLPGLELVVHADLPQNREALLHRSGRTGRAGAKGISAMIVPQNQRKKAERLLKSAKVTANWGKPPAASEIRARDNDRLIENFEASSPEGEEDVITRLLADNTPEAIAAAYIAQYRKGRSAPEELGDVGSVDAAKQNRGFEKSVWVTLSVGREQRAEPRWLIPLICRAGGVTKQAIGAIRMVAKETFVELDAKLADEFFETVGPKNELEDGITFVKLDGAPDASKFTNSRSRQDRGNPRFDKGGKPPRRDDRPAHAGAKDRPKKRYDDNNDRGEDRKEKRHDKRSDSFDKPRKPSDKKREKRPDTRAEKAVKDGSVTARKPRHTKPPKSDFAPKFGGAADATPRRGGASKPAGKPAGKSGGKPAGKPAGKPKSSPPKGFNPKDTSQRSNSRKGAKAGARGKTGKKPGGARS